MDWQRVVCFSEDGSHSLFKVLKEFVGLFVSEVLRQ